MLLLRGASRRCISSKAHQAAALLGVRASAPPRELQAAFRRKALAVHPDTRERNQAGRGDAREFIALRSALAVLLEEHGETTTQSSPPYEYDDFADFGRRHRQQYHQKKSYNSDYRDERYRDFEDEFFARNRRKRGHSRKSSSWGVPAQPSSFQADFRDAVHRAQHGPQLEFDAVNRVFADADEFPRRFEIEERVYSKKVPLLAIVHGQIHLGDVDFLSADEELAEEGNLLNKDDDKATTLRLSLLGKTVATATRRLKGSSSTLRLDVYREDTDKKKQVSCSMVRSWKDPLTFAGIGGFSMGSVVDRLGIPIFQVSTSAAPGVSETSFTRVGAHVVLGVAHPGTSVCQVSRAWMPPAAFRIFGARDRNYASDGLSSSYYIERRSDNRTFRRRLASDPSGINKRPPPSLDPALPVFLTAFAAHDREQQRAREEAVEEAPGTFLRSLSRRGSFNNFYRRLVRWCDNNYK